MSIDHLPEGKQAAIIQALIDEYSVNGYDKASTNIICNAAGISKGSLFNYIGNKSEQYMFVVQYAQQKLMEKMMSYMTTEPETDRYFDKLLARSKVKLKLMTENKKLYQLVLDAYYVPPAQLKDAFEAMFGKFSLDSLEAEKQLLDPSLLKHPDDRDRVVELIYYFVYGYTESKLKSGDRTSINDWPTIVEDIVTDMEQYFDSLERAFFK